MDLLWDLLKAYGTSGRLFAFAHLGLMFFIAYRVRGIALEAFHLEGWKAEPTASSTPDRPESLKTLDRFVAECQELGPQGFFVPLTDFSDRLDSMVEGKLSDLYNLINMMLIIGIAGSLFGLFEFALNSSEQLANLGKAGVGTGQFSELLSASMAKAFPVAFVGLALMLLLQVLAAWPEGRLRNGVSTAIGRAVDERRRISRSQAAIVQQAVGEIGAAMKPLENLEGTLQSSIMPVVTKFGEEMRRSHGFFKKQFDDLSGATSKIEDAVRGVEANVKILQEASELLGGTLKAAPELIQKTTEIQERHLEVLTKYESTLAGASDGLEGSVKDFGKRIDLVIATYREALVETQEKIGQYARGSVDETKDRLSQSIDMLDTLLEQSSSTQTTHLASIEASIGTLDTRVKETFESLSTGIRGELSQAITELSAEARSQSEEFLGHITGSVQAVADVAEAASRSLGALEALPSELSQGIQGSMVELHTGLREQVDTLIGSAAKRIEDSQGLIERLEEKIPELEGLMRTFIQNTQSTANQLADQVVGKWLEVSEGFSTNLIKATDSLEKLADLPEHTEEQISKTLQGLQVQLKRDLEGTWKGLLNETQSKLLTQLEAIRTGSQDIGKELREAAAEWHRSAREVARSIEDPIRETVEAAKGQLQETLIKVDFALAQRYPDVIKDAERFTDSLSQLVEKMESAARAANISRTDYVDQEMVSKTPPLVDHLPIDSVGGNATPESLISAKMRFWEIPITLGRLKRLLFWKKY